MLQSWYAVESIYGLYLMALKCSVVFLIYVYEWERKGFMEANRQRKAMSILLATMMIAGLASWEIDSSATKKAILAKKSISVEEGKTKKIIIKSKKNKAKYLFSSSRKKVAKVSSSGKITGVKKGTAKITVRERAKVSGKTKTRKLGVVKVTVTKKKSSVVATPTNMPDTSKPMAEPILVPTATATATTTAIATPIATATPEPTEVPITIPTLAPTGDEYNKEIFRVAMENTKLETVNGNTCKVDMQYFKGVAEGTHFNGKVYKESSVVTKAYKDGRADTCSRFILSGKDGEGNAAKIFVQAQTAVDKDGKEQFIRPVLATNCKSLAWIENADIKPVLSSDNVLHFMWNESNKEPVTPPAVTRPDTSHQYTKEIFRFFIDIKPTDEVKGTSVSTSMIHFGGRGDFDTFKGEVVGDSTDTRIQYKGQTQTLSARYILEGTDAKGNPCRVYVENNGIDDNGTMTTEPIIITDCPDYAWIESAPLHGTVSWESGLTIHMWTTEDGK